MNDKITKALETVNELHGETMKKLDDGISIKSIPHPKNMGDMAEEIIRLTEENEELTEHINNLQEIVREDMKELVQYRAENEKLRAALKPFADAADDFIAEKHDMTRAIVALGDLRAARAALKETGDE